MLNAPEIELIRLTRHGDPFSVLGPHTDADGRHWLRAFLPGATHVVAVDAADGAALAPLLLVHIDGLFESSVAAQPASGYRLQAGATVNPGVVLGGPAPRGRVVEGEA